MVCETLLVLFAVFQPPPAPELKKTDMEEFQGTWKVVLARTINGDPDRNLIGRKVKIFGNKMESFNKSGESEGIAIFNLDPQKMPKQIDAYVIKGREKFTQPGIYTFKKNQLWVCWSSSRERPRRPTDFEKVGGVGEFRVFILERQKD